MAISGDLLHRQLTERILGTFYQVYNELGCGFLESVYGAAMHLALQADGLNAERQTTVAVFFRGRVVGEFRADLIVERRVVIELKACRAIDPAHEAQLLNYLRATELEVGLLLNFGPKPSFKRLAFANSRKLLPPNPRYSASIRGPI